MNNKKYQRGDAFAGFVLVLAISQIIAAIAVHYGESRDGLLPPNERLSEYHSCVDPDLVSPIPRPFHS